MRRRDILKRLSLLPLAAIAIPALAGGFQTTPGAGKRATAEPSPGTPATAAPGLTSAETSGYTSSRTSKPSATGTPPPAAHDLFAELGVTRVINANVTMTFLSGSLMLPEVLEAINSTSHDFANMFELQDKVSGKIAEMLKVEGAMVTSGAACAILPGTAACITGTDKDKIKLLPNLPGPRPEVIMQKSHRYLFDQAVTTTGAKIVEAEGPGEMGKDVLKALNEGNPRIVAGSHNDRLLIGVVLLRPDQADIVAQRVKQILEHAV